MVSAEIRERYCGWFVGFGEPILNGEFPILLGIGSDLTALMSLAAIEFIENQSPSTLKKSLSTLPCCAAEVNIMLTFTKLYVFFRITFSLGAIIFLCMVVIPQQIFGYSGSMEESPRGGN